MDEPLEDVYFNWLYAKVASVDVPTPSLTFYTLLRDLHAIEFVWNVTGDDNRMQDGLDIRREFLRNLQVSDSGWEHMPCSVLEMLIAFSRKTAFETSLSSREWFWIFLDNLGLAEFSDARANISQRVYDCVERFVWRTYRADGHGGIFPLNNPEEDQRRVELWYQFHAYISDKDL